MALLETETIGKRNVGIASGPWDAAGVRQVFECAQGRLCIDQGTDALREAKKVF